jgi:hypothetical protein
VIRHAGPPAAGWVTRGESCGGVIIAAATDGSRDVTIKGYSAVNTHRTCTTAAQVRAWVVRTVAERAAIDAKSDDGATATVRSLDGESRRDWRECHHRFSEIPMTKGQVVRALVKTQKRPPGLGPGNT